MAPTPETESRTIRDIVFGCFRRFLLGGWGGQHSRILEWRMGTIVSPGRDGACARHDWDQSSVVAEGRTGASWRSPGWACVRGLRRARLGETGLRWMGLDSGGGKMGGRFVVGGFGSSCVIVVRSGCSDRVSTGPKRVWSKVASLGPLCLLSASTCDQKRVFITHPRVARMPRYPHTTYHSR